jgi:hypothetical protein
MPILRAAVLVLAMAGSAGAAEPPSEPGVMLRAGEWQGGAGVYSVPKAFDKLPPSTWPATGWTRLAMADDHIQSDPQEAPKGKFPEFLRAIVGEVEAARGGRTDSEEPPAVEWKDELYLRVPGTRIREGSIPVYLFKNGTRKLFPQLDNRYELKLDAQAFAVTVRNGSRTKTGAPYGNGAQYTIEYDGNSYEYTLGEYGWDSSIVAIADLDGDGKPDFIIRVGGNNSGYEAVLLSSKARPGKNVPTASLHQMGC